MPYGHVHEHMSDGDRITRFWPYTISGFPNGHNQWGPTVKESGIRNLIAAATFYKKFDEETQQSLVNRAFKC